MVKCTFRVNPLTCELPADVNPTMLRRAVVGAMQNNGAEFKEGQAPRTNLERRVQANLERHQGKKGRKEKDGKSEV